MTNSEINFKVELDDNRVPERIFWDATENPNEGINETKAISIGVWDQYHKGLLGINLWTKDMPVDEMNHFVVDLVGNLAQMITDSTQDEVVISALHEAGQKIAKHLNEQAKKEQSQQSQQ
ncbi:gliding motility protein GldC [Marinilongibacter aquaticus]|uniref:gliding motility protein GldC n=1 Tax=Marinilongibacter aquaticus TaxID=2975157 RepID=UPI0021BDA8B0|nr:gliding motility protein GldC [Marinilongibacter aquaticus]UBM59119.1 gliding motility protein GldC [Marinilongibacter aquaticus]